MRCIDCGEEAVAICEGNSYCRSHLEKVYSANWIDKDEDLIYE